MTQYEEATSVMEIGFHVSLLTRFLPFDVHSSGTDRVPKISPCAGEYQVKLRHSFC